MPRLDDLRHRLAHHHIAWIQPIGIDLAVLHDVAIVGIEREVDRPRQELTFGRDRDRDLIGAEVLGDG